MQIFLLFFVSAFFALFGHVSSQIDITTYGCTPEEREYLSVAFADARTMVEMVLDWEERNANRVVRLTWSGLKTLQERYFGRITAEEQKTITMIFHKINSRWSSTKYYCVHEGDNWHDLCQEDLVGAFAHQSDRKIGFCPAFFQSPQYFDILRQAWPKNPNDTYWPTAGHVILHELAHMEAIDGRYITDVPVRWPSEVDERMDALAYGAERTQYLAHHCPKAAMLNADNYAMYASAIAIGAHVGLPAAQQFDKTEIVGFTPWLKVVRSSPPPHLHHWKEMIERDLKFREVEAAWAVGFGSLITVCWTSHSERVARAALALLMVYTVVYMAWKLSTT